MLGAVGLRGCVGAWVRGGDRRENHRSFICCLSGVQTISPHLGHVAVLERGSGELTSGMLHASCSATIFPWTST